MFLIHVFTMKVMLCTGWTAGSRGIDRIFVSAN